MGCCRMLQQMARHEQSTCEWEDHQAKRCSRSLLLCAPGHRRGIWEGASGYNRMGACLPSLKICVCAHGRGMMRVLSSVEMNGESGGCKGPDKARGHSRVCEVRERGRG